MKIGRIPIVAIALLLVALVRYISKLYFGPTEYAYVCFMLDGVLLGVLFCYLLYYANIYVSAWVKNRKEERAV
jgi:hypothetical protein